MESVVVLQGLVTMGFRVLNCPNLSFLSSMVPNPNTGLVSARNISNSMGQSSVDGYELLR
jgi:hypothetical protein